MNPTGMQSNPSLHVKGNGAMSWTLAVDIDGTITHDGMVHLGALGALRNIALMGHNVVYVTGRSSIEAYILAMFGGTGTISIGENGGCITTGPSSHVLLGDVEPCKRAYKTLQDTLPDVREMPIFPRMTEVVLERTLDVHEAADIVRSHHPDVTISDSGYGVHLNSLGIDKGRGLRELYARYGAQRDHTISIGDSSTDVPMFLESGLSVALSNASSDVASQADIQTKFPGGDGVMEALQTLAPRLAVDVQ